MKEHQLEQWYISLLISNDKTMAVKEEEAQVIKVNKLIVDLGAILEAGKYLNIWKLNNNF